MTATRTEIPAEWLSAWTARIETALASTRYQDARGAGDGFLSIRVVPASIQSSPDGRDWQDQVSAPDIVHIADHDDAASLLDVPGCLRRAVLALANLPSSMANRHGCAIVSVRRARRGANVTPGTIVLMAVIARQTGRGIEFLSAS